MLVEVWSDVVCPWCYIGKRRLQRAIDQLDADPSFGEPIEVVARPFQLDPGAPPGAATPVADVYARKFGGPERAAAIIDHVTVVAAVEGLVFRLDRALRANTRDAHRLLAFAGAHGRPGVQADVDERLFAAYFTDGLDIGDRDVLVAIGAAAGLDGDAVRRVLGSHDGVAELDVELEAAAEAGITAVPTYGIDGRWTIPGAQDPSVFVQVLTRLAARRAG